MYPRDFPPSFAPRLWRALSCTRPRSVVANTWSHGHTAHYGRVLFGNGAHHGTREPDRHRRPGAVGSKNLCVHPSKFRPDRGAKSERLAAFAARSMVPPGEPLGRGRTLPNLEPAPQVNQRKIFKKSLGELLTFRIYKYIFRYTRI